MDNLFIYLLKVNASLVVFYLCYKLFFQRDTFWTLRRIYLMVSAVFSFIYPLVSVENWLKKQEPIMNAIAAIRLNEFIATPNGAGRMDIFSVRNVLWAVFGFIAAIMFLRIGIQLFSILKQRATGTSDRLYGVPIIRMEKKITPFSFFKWIFINPLLHNRSETDEILAHEQTHARQWHSVDVIIGQLQTLLCWVNPAAWLMEREIRDNLEFLADNQVIKSGFEPKKYQYHLLQLTYEPADSKLANNFNVLPIKKRIKMMNTKKTKKAGLLKYMVVIPMALTMLIMSNMQSMIAATKSIVESVAVNEFKPDMVENTVLKTEPNLQQQKKKTVQSTETEVKRDAKVFDVVEVPPTFPGGVGAMYEWLNKNIIYPAEAQTKKIQGKVFAIFVIDKTGKILDPKIVRGVDPLLDAEALRVIKTMPDWTPGKQGGVNVAVRYTLPVVFKLFGGNKTEEKSTSNVKVATLSEHNAKNTTSKSNPDKNGVYNIVDVPPAFPGGVEAMYEWLNKNILYPAEAQTKKIQGKVITEFVVDETGKISNVQVVRSVHPSLDKEGVRVIGAMPAWTPGKQKGKAVKVRYILPIQFKIN